MPKCKSTQNSTGQKKRMLGWKDTDMAASPQTPQKSRKGLPSYHIQAERLLHREQGGIMTSEESQQVRKALSQPSDGGLFFFFPPRFLPSKIFSALFWWKLALKSLLVQFHLPIKEKIKPNVFLQKTCLCLCFHQDAISNMTSVKITTNSP